jgi:rubrerythrin
MYLRMKNVVPDHLGEKKLDDIIKEEMGHIILISKKLLEFNK